MRFLKAFYTQIIYLLANVCQGYLYANVNFTLLAIHALKSN